MPFINIEAFRGIQRLHTSINSEAFKGIWGLVISAASFNKYSNQGRKEQTYTREQHQTGNLIYRAHDFILVVVAPSHWRHEAALKAVTKLTCRSAHSCRVYRWLGLYPIRTSCVPEEEVRPMSSLKLDSRQCFMLGKSRHKLYRRGIICLEPVGWLSARP
eukprot:1157299-Pelagomonas_calceolata.AAC.2